MIDLLKNMEICPPNSELSKQLEIFNIIDHNRDAIIHKIIEDGMRHTYTESPIGYFKYGILNCKTQIDEELKKLIEEI